MTKRKSYRYQGYIPQEDFAQFLRIVAYCSPTTIHKAGQVVLKWLKQEKKELWRQAAMIEDLLERYG